MEKPLPGLKDLESMALAMARKRARIPADAEDLFQEAMFAVSKALRKKMRAEHPWRLAKTIMQRAMVRYYKRQDRHAPEGHPIDLTPYVARTGAEQQDLLLGVEFFDALEGQCGAQARRVAENLVSVRDPKCIEQVMLSGAPRYSMRAIRDGLGMHPKTWRATLGEVRTFTEQWLA
jgi:DNA-directed RNA polymerase specialized sigma24 family protein